MTDPNPIPTVDYGRNTNRADVLIIGAGISGMTAAIEMIRKGNGRNFIIVEKGNQIGGTWSDQRYPGCCCDVWSHLYSLSFEPNPRWTREYPGQEEILDYLIDVAHKYKLYKHIRFNTSVDEARWDEDTKTWKTKLHRLGSKDAEFGKGYTVTSDFLVSAVGQLNVPQYPDIPGLDTFSGKVMHSARWDWDYDLRDKKIGIIGNGATAVQIIPEIASVCKSLIVFQRTPNWVVPRDDKPVSPLMQSIYKYVPFIQRRYRAALMDVKETLFDAIFSLKSPASEFLMNLSKEHMETQLPGDQHAELRQKLQPHFAVGCKRVILSDDYFPTFTRENITLETSQIREVTSNGVSVEVTKEHDFDLDDGEEHDLDLLVLATGFKTLQFMYPIKIYGSEGRSIEDVWSTGACAYLGMTVPSMPNFSMLYGPNTNLGHSSVILMIEAQALYINALITEVKNARDRGNSISLKPKSVVFDAYNEDMQARLSKSAFADPNCNSWYKNEAGLITNNWSDAVIPYQKKTSSISWNDFIIDGADAEQIKQKGKTSWSRVVEETQISNTVILAGLLTAVGAVAAGALARGAGKTLLRR